jgi:hypothetical protein
VTSSRLTATSSGSSPSAPSRDQQECRWPPSTYYDTKARGPSQRAQRDAELGPALAALWGDNYRVYGLRKLWKAARRAGHDVSRDQVARLIRAAGIEGVRRGTPIWSSATSLPARPTSCGSPI